ncbi:MAG: hypothetical protein HYZ25_04910 [Chloroflexi bacterium]|nr:hypothetical protein [Chloroflexota bacterium]
MNMKRLIPVILAIALTLSACNLPSNAPATPDLASTTIAQTVQAALTSSAPMATNTVPAPAITTVAPPTVAPPPTRVVPTATSTCDIAQFITDVTIPDGTVLTPGQAFTKTWRVKNVGTCSWTPSYAVVFSSGNSMNGPATQALTGNVNPGQTVDISINLTAPSTPGDYTGYWKLRNAAGVLFTQFYVQMKVATPTPTFTLPPAVAQVVLNAVGSESGTVYEPGAGQGIPSTVLAGDTSTNFLARGYLSFDISSLSGKTINSATLNLSSCSAMQNPFASLSGIWVGELQYALPLDQTDYDVAGTGIVLLNSVPGSGIDVKSFVQTRATEGRARFQIRLHPAGPSDLDGQADYLTCNPGSVTLTIQYQP